MGQADDEREFRSAGGALTLLHIFPSFAYGGQQARLAALARGLGPRFRHCIVALDGDLSASALFETSIAATFDTFAMRKSGFVSLSNLSGFRRLFKRAAPDLLCTYNWGAIEAALANRLGPKLPHVHFEDGFGPDEAAGPSPRRSFARRLLLRDSILVVPSRRLEAIAREHWRAARLMRIANGVDFGRLQANRRREGASALVGSVGSLRPEKNYARLIRIFRAADREGMARLEIVGGGPEAEALQALSKGDARIRLPGATRSPEDAYARFDIFALSSDTEQAPVSLMEAMAAGLPVVAPAVGDIAAMVSDENRLFITPPGDEEALAHALAQLLQNESLRVELGEANRAKARTEYSLAAMVERHRALYLELASRGA